MRSTQNPDIRATPRAFTARVILLTTCALAVVASDANSVTAAPQARFGPGELMWFDLSYGVVPAGYARIAVGDNPGDDVWPIVVDYRTNEGVSRFFRVRERFVTHWDPEVDRTRGFDHYRNTDGAKGVTRARLDPLSGQATTREVRPGQAPKERKKKVGPVGQDFASTLFWLRRQPLDDGERANFHIFSGRKNISMKTEVEGRERIEVLGRKWDAVRVRMEAGFGGKYESRAMYIWYSDDDAHVPLRMKADLALGSVGVELSKYEPGL